MMAHKLENNMNQEEMMNLDMTGLATHMRDLKNDIDSRKTTLAIVQKEFDLLRKIILPEQMENWGFENINVTDVGRISLRAEMYASIKKEQKEEAYAWLSENGHGSLIKDTVNASSLKALIKEQLSLGEEIPDEIFNVSPYTMATLTKA